MAKKPTLKQAKSDPRQVAADPTPTPVARPVLSIRPWLPYIIILLFTSGIYINTLWNKYTIDDTLVLTDNKFTLQGFGGIKDLMTHDAFVGFFGERGSGLVSGGRYRPLSIVSLAVEIEFFGLNPAVSHAVNVFLFTLTCLLLYYFLSYLLPHRKDVPFYLTIPFIATMLYAGHPIHTEAVANIKGRDEIMGMLFSLLALAGAVKYVKTNQIIHVLGGVVFFFLGLLSKENAITFMAVIPLTFYYFTHAKTKHYVFTIALYIIPVIAFLAMRQIYTKAGITAESPEILNNPFAYLPKTTEGFLQRYATIIYTFLLYFKLLIFPHPLTHDYYFNQVPFIGATDIGFIVSLLVNGGLLIFALMGLRKKSLASYAILFYFITFSIVSNLLFTVGILMNERFVYMCSLGFCILLALLLVSGKEKLKLSNTVFTGMIAFILLLYSVKTISRNTDWVDNLSLFLIDSKVSTNSSKVQMSAGGDLTKLVDENFDTLRSNGRLKHITDLLDMNIDINAVPDSILKKQILKKSIEYLNRTLVIYPTHSNAWLLLGNASYKLDKDTAKAIEYYQKAAAYRVGGYYDAWYNIGCVQIENNQVALAKENFLKALAIKPEEYACRYNLAEAYKKLMLPDSAIYWYKKTLEVKPLDAASNYMIGTIYGKQLNQLALAIEYLNKAIQCNPNVEVYYEDLGVAYGLSGQYDASIAISNRCIQKFPNYAPAYMNLAVSYRNKGNIQLADQNMQKANQLRASK